MVDVEGGEEPCLDITAGRHPMLDLRTGPDVVSAPITATLLLCLASSLPIGLSIDSRKRNNICPSMPYPAGAISCGLDPGDLRPTGLVFQT